jgi:hypothetical protein
MWTGEVRQERFVVTKIKVYPVLVHWLKATQSAALFNLPKTGKAFRLRLAMLKKITTTREFPSTLNEIRYAFQIVDLVL